MDFIPRKMAKINYPFSPDTCQVRKKGIDNPFIIVLAGAPELFKNRKEFYH